MSSSRNQRDEALYESQNDTRLDDLHSKLRTLRHVTIDIHNDAHAQNRDLDNTSNSPPIRFKYNKGKTNNASRQFIRDSVHRVCSSNRATLTQVSPGPALMRMICASVQITVALTGSDVVTTLVSNPNEIDRPWWMPSFWPGNLRPRDTNGCQPLSLIDAQSLHTNSSVSLFSYSFRRANVASSKDNEDPTKQMRPVPYMANTLDECSIQRILWTLELPTQRMQFKSNIFCKLGGHKQFTFKVPDNITLAMTHHRALNLDMGQDDMLDYISYNAFLEDRGLGVGVAGFSTVFDGLPANSSSANNVLAVLDGLQRDLYMVIRTELMLRQMNNVFFHSTYVVEWIAGSGTQCFDSQNWALNGSYYTAECGSLRDPGRVLRAYGTTNDRGAGYDLYPEFLAPFGVTSTNLLIALRDAIRIDLGDLDTTSNIFLNKTYFDEVMEVDPYPAAMAPLLINAEHPWRVSYDHFWMSCSAWSCVNGTWVERLKNTPADVPYENIVLPYRPTSQTASVLNLSYLCPKLQRKPILSLLMSVFVATATMYNFLLAIFCFVMPKIENWYQRRPKRRTRKDLNDPEWQVKTLLLPQKHKQESDDMSSLESENEGFLRAWRTEETHVLRGTGRSARTGMNSTSAFRYSA
ncbi:Bet1-like protein [Rhizoctonia solani AG-1 IB]|uniref:Bet1-like protein n=1 Tax=Thanatephorus cucumeris (strain AG1-IB / isolate 7/3/14) TaxID=1108050 RepID=M5C7W8_THACB|nr:Bet1-like protein [Rhizoctonia solani AG-1 IB]